MKRDIVYFSLLGGSFLLFEYVVRCIARDNNYFHPALLLMFFIGGLCSFLVGLFNRSDWVNRNINIFWQSIISGGIIITGIELISGVVCNLWLRLNIWEYFSFMFNFLGQISLFTTLAWIGLSPFAMWLDDFLYWVEYRGKPWWSEDYYYSLAEIYKKALNPFGKAGEI